MVTKIQLVSIRIARSPNPALAGAGLHDKAQTHAIKHDCMSYLSVRTPALRKAPPMVAERRAPQCTHRSPQCPTAQTTRAP
eukprot:355359-Chlamydomonas_euryale.AAC.11